MILVYILLLCCAFGSHSGFLSFLLLLDYLKLAKFIFLHFSLLVDHFVCLLSIHGTGTHDIFLLLRWWLRRSLLSSPFRLFGDSVGSSLVLHIISEVTTVISLQSWILLGRFLLLIFQLTRFAFSTYGWTLWYVQHWLTRWSLGFCCLLNLLCIYLSLHFLCKFRIYLDSFGLSCFGVTATHFLIVLLLI